LAFAHTDGDGDVLSLVREDELAACLRGPQDDLAVPGPQVGDRSGTPPGFAIAAAVGVDLEADAVWIQSSLTLTDAASQWTDEGRAVISARIVRTQRA
jgi:hypothetical protein